MKSFLLLLSLALILTSCGTKNKISNDLENSTSWINSNTLVKGNAHSGSFASKIDSTNVCSFGYSKKLKDITTKNIKSVTFSAWVYYEKIPKETKICISLLRSNPFWTSVDVKLKASEPKKWQKVSITSNLPNDITPEDELRCYVSSFKQDVVLIDDVELSYK